MLSCLPTHLCDNNWGSWRTRIHKDLYIEYLCCRVFSGWENCNYSDWGVEESWQGEVHKLFVTHEFVREWVPHRLRETGNYLAAIVDECWFQLVKFVLWAIWACCWCIDKLGHAVYDRLRWCWDRTRQCFTTFRQLHPSGLVWRDPLLHTSSILRAPLPSFKEFPLLLRLSGSFTRGTELRPLGIDFRSAKAR